MFWNTGRMGRGDIRTAILVALTEEPMHAYRMQQLIKERRKDDIVNVSQRNSVYQTIQRLVRDGLAEVSSTGRAENRPERTTYRITDGDPTSAEVEVRCTTGLGRGKWQTRVETESRMTSTASEFAVSQRLDAFEGDARIYSRIWELAFPRDGV